MGQQSKALPLAEDGMPKIDVIELATAILHGDGRKATMVSVRETLAMAQALIDFNGALATASAAIFQIEMLARMPHSKQLHDSANFFLRELKDKLVVLNMYEGEG